MKHQKMVFLLIAVFLTSAGYAQDLYYAERAFPELYDPVFGGHTFEGERINALVHSGLYGLDRHGSVEYQLARAFPLYTENGKRLDIEIRDDVMWSDGKAFTVDDVIYSWRILKSMENPFKAGLENIQKMEKLTSDPKHLLVTLVSPDPNEDFHRFLNFPILPEHIIGGLSYTKHDDYAEYPVNIGRYTFASKESNKIELKPLFWPHDSQNQTHIRNILIELIPDVGSHFNIFTQRTTNFILDIPSSGLNQVLSRPDEFGARDYAANTISAIVFNNKHKLLANVEARQALSMILDRKRMLRDRYFRKADLITGPYTNGSSFYDQTIEPYEFSPEKAKRLLERIGCSWDKDNNLSYKSEKVVFRFIQNTAKVSENDDIILKDYLEKLEEMGFTVEVNAISNEGIFLDKLINKKDDYELAFITLKYPGDAALKNVFMSQKKMNFAQYEDSQTDNLFIQLESSENIQHKIVLGKKIHLRIHERAPVFFLWSHNRTAGYNINQIDNIDIDPRSIFNAVTTWKAMNP